MNRKFIIGEIARLQCQATYLTYLVLILYPASKAINSACNTLNAAAPASLQRFWQRPCGSSLPSQQSVKEKKVGVVRLQNVTNSFTSDL
jgi:hypothetical protein